MRKVYRALTDACVEKQFIPQGAETPAGWFDTPKEALAAYVSDKPRRGRPRAK